MLDLIQIDNNFSEFADSITLGRIQENKSTGHGSGGLADYRRFVGPREFSLS